jgi:hypothetical protein
METPALDFVSAIAAPLSSHPQQIGSRAFTPIDADLKLSEVFVCGKSRSQK